MAERTISPIIDSFRREALEILAGNNTASLKVPIRNGKIVLQPLKHGFRIDVIGRDQTGKPQRLATTHYSELSRARGVGMLLSRTMRIRFDDQTRKAGQ